ncbi:MAG: class I SAM-dependent methyltransferase [Parcubacteria group bacterium]|nr:class I SAM-dependent methyltransferase [Parcubacteria group bacterium]
MPVLAVVLITIVLILTVFTLIGMIIFAFFPILTMGAPFVPSYRPKNKNSSAHLAEAINFVKNHGGGQKSVDLGSGDGRVVREFARCGLESWGVEINPLLVLWSRAKIKKAGLKNAHIKWGSLWKADLSGFDIVYMFQCNLTNKFLFNKFKKELKPSAYVISFGFPMHGLRLVKEVGSFLIYQSH